MIEDSASISERLQRRENASKVLVCSRSRGTDINTARIRCFPGTREEKNPNNAHSRGRATRRDSDATITTRLIKANEVND